MTRKEFEGYLLAVCEKHNLKWTGQWAEDFNSTTLGFEDKNGIFHYIDTQERASEKNGWSGYGVKVRPGYLDEYTDYLENEIEGFLVNNELV